MIKGKRVAFESNEMENSRCNMLSHTQKVSRQRPNEGRACGNGGSQRKRPHTKHVPHLCLKHKQYFSDTPNVKRTTEAIMCMCISICSYLLPNITILIHPNRKGSEKQLAYICLKF